MPDLSPTSHVDTFTRDRIRAVEPWPDLRLPDGTPRGAFNAVSVFVDAPAVEFGDRTALIAENGCWTYRSFATRVEQAAGLLARERGLRPGQRVLLRGRTSPWFAVWLHAVLKAGGVVVPVSPRLRSSEIAQIVEACAASLIVCDPEDADLVSDAPILTYPDDMERQAASFATVPTAADDVALLAFSSGTTGVPKATMHFHRDLANLTSPARRELLGIGPGVVVASNRAVTFPYALVGLCLMPFRYGATTLLRHYDEVAGFFHAVAEFDARVVLSDPSSYRTVLAAGTLPQGDRAYFSCAETLAPVIARQWREQTGTVLRNWLGVTEHTLTGDWAHADADGYLWLHGRTDDMVNVAGILVGPADIESILFAHPRVARAAAIGVPDPDHGDRMHAFLTLSPDADPAAVIAEVRAALETHLADYKRPEQLTVLTQMPYGPTGKIDRRSLRERLTPGQDAGALGSGR